MIGTSWLRLCHARIGCGPARTGSKPRRKRWYVSHAAIIGGGTERITSRVRFAYPGLL
jgi:hypothetical protein